MRGILFRGMTEDKRWIEGSLADQNGYYISTLPRLGKENKGVYAFDDFEKVLPETIGQYTGLCDKNGVKIFEGDIVESISGKHDHIGVVRYCKAHFVIEWDRLKDELRNDLHFWASERKLEVIGNIYENKELLEGSGW